MFQDFGVGVGLRAPYLNEFWETSPRGISWAEVISENYMPWPDGLNSRPLSKLLHIRKNIPIALHGVSLSLGSTDPLSTDYLKSLRELCARVEPRAVSDHLCWTGVDGENLHDLLPLPYTREAAEHVAARISRVQDFLKRRILIENVSSYVELPESEMTEWEFLACIVEKADCGILLDINNVYVSGFNHGFDPVEYLRAIPAERVGQIHLAGHTNKGDYLNDTHDQPVCEHVWTLYRWWIRNKGLQSAMIERDGNFPQWSELKAETQRIGEIRKEKREETACQAPLS